MCVIGVEAVVLKPCLLAGSSCSSFLGSPSSSETESTTTFADISGMVLPWSATVSKWTRLSCIFVLQQTPWEGRQSRSLSGHDSASISTMFIETLYSRLVEKETGILSSWASSREALTTT